MASFFYASQSEVQGLVLPWTSVFCVKVRKAEALCGFPVKIFTHQGCANFCAIKIHKKFTRFLLSKHFKPIILVV